MKPFLILLTFLLTNISYAQTKYEKDFNEFWKDVNANYAYFDQQKINWSTVKEIYEPHVKEIDNDKDFIRLLEKVLNEFHNGHISLNTNLSSSNRIIPTGQDLFIQKRNDKFYISDIRKGFGAALSGLKTGNEVVLFNGKKIKEQLDPFLPKYTTSHTEAMYQYAINMLFAGTHDTKRILTINENGLSKNVYPDSFKQNVSETLLDKKIVSKKTVYLKVNNSLGNDSLIRAFDNAIDTFIHYKNLIIDLTETPSGGNTTVARSIMGRFINKPTAYQQHEFDEKEFETKRMWIEYVTPRKQPFKGNVFILVGHWTGSMGEGIAIGLDGMKRAKVIGTQMAGLIGAVNGFILSETKIGYQIPIERLYHINGTPRELFKPPVLTKNTDETYHFMETLK
jgi:C-terminal processing protease CtpA/Prc